MLIRQNDKTGMLPMTQWEMPDDNFDLTRFKKFLVINSYRETTIDTYEFRVAKYLKFAKTDKPSSEHAIKFIQTLVDKRLSHSTINNYSIAIMAYHRFAGDPYLKLPLLKVVNEIPSYFTEDEVNKIFSMINNFKHYTMLKILFYGCLRASELCDLDISDINLSDLTLHIRDGKGGKPAKVMINDECGKLLDRYLAIRPTFFEDHRQPLFFTERGRRWNRHYLYQMFSIYKMKAGIKRKGGLHVFSRHTTATLMTSKGLDIRIVKEILRHEDIRTTLRYSHVADTTKREKYNTYLQL